MKREAANAIKQRLGPHLPYLAVLGPIALSAGLPLFQFKLMAGHEFVAYWTRSIEFYQGLNSGQLFPRWASASPYRLPRNTKPWLTSFRTSTNSSRDHPLLRGFLVGNCLIVDND